MIEDKEKSYIWVPRTGKWLRIVVSNLLESDLFTNGSCRPWLHGSAADLCTRRCRLKSNPVYFSGSIRNFTILEDANTEAIILRRFYPDSRTICLTRFSFWMTEWSKDLNFLFPVERNSKRDVATSKKPGIGCSDVEFARLEACCRN